MFTWSESCCLFGVFSLVVARHYFGTLTLGCSMAVVWCGLPSPPPLCHTEFLFVSHPFHIEDVWISQASGLDTKHRGQLSALPTEWGVNSDCHRGKECENTLRKCFWKETPWASVETEAPAEEKEEEEEKTEFSICFQLFKKTWTLTGLGKILCHTWEYGAKYWFRGFKLGLSDKSTSWINWICGLKWRFYL